MNKLFLKIATHFEIPKTYEFEILISYRVKYDHFKIEENWLHYLSDNNIRINSIPTLPSLLYKVYMIFFKIDNINLLIL